MTKKELKKPEVLNPEDEKENDEENDEESIVRPGRKVM